MEIPKHMSHVKIPPGFRCGRAYVQAAIARENSAEALAQAAGYGEESGSARDTSRIEQTCGACATAVIVESGDILTAEGCTVSGSCEKTWAAIHPDQYLRDAENPTAQSIPCGGAECSMVLQLKGITDGKVEADIRARTAREMDENSPHYDRCKVDREGDIFRKQGRFALDNMPLTDTVRSSAVEDDSMPMDRVLGIAESTEFRL